MLYPLTFRPIFKERLWGGRALETLYGKALPANLTIGESWVISDRPDDVSVIENGPLAGRSLHSILEQHCHDLLGSAPAAAGRFPLLIKILDARQTLSLQVHPPAATAPELNGEPKTEMWFIADARPNAHIFAGLKRGVSRAQFEQKVQSGAVADCFHRLEVHPGDAMFVPSGRVHGIGAGCIIFEVQQNSDTTYRVFDWNRVGSDGRARELHVAESLKSINFDDYEPGLIEVPFQGESSAQVRHLVGHQLFTVELWQLAAGESLNFTTEEALILGVTNGQVLVHHQTEPVDLRPGRFCLIPASMERARVTAMTSVQFLAVRPK